MSNDVTKKKGKAVGEKKTKRKAKRRETYAVYIYKVLKQVSVGKCALYVCIFLLLLSLVLKTLSFAHAQLGWWRDNVFIFADLSYQYDILTP